MVYVQDINGKPMMPTTRHGKVRRLLKDKKAVVVNLCPFTIKLTYVTSDYKQEIVLGVDAGTKHVGLSATTKSKELYSSEVILRNDIVDLLSTRRELRRSRRNRLRYRKPRFDNRIKSKRPGWVAPSVRYKIDAHIRVIDNVCSILPISRIVIEVAQFDTQKINNPNISGKEYQEGNELGFWNVREYVLARDGHKCQHCKGKSKDKILNVHHIESRKTGGDSPSNLITLCETCHKEYHKGNDTKGNELINLNENIDMTGEEKCNRCEQFGPNGLTDYPCKRIPSRNCPWFIKISDKKYKKILADRVKRIKENEKLKQEMMKDQDLIEEVKQNTKRLMQ